MFSGIAVFSLAPCVSESNIDALGTEDGEEDVEIAGHDGMSLTTEF